MLVLSRKSGQRIQIGKDVTIVLIRVAGRTARIGIEAPDSVPIVRTELELEPEPEPEDESDANHKAA